MSFGSAGGLDGLNVAALGGAGEEVALQHHGFEEAALDMPENAAEVVGAEAGGDGGEAGVGCFLGEGLVEVLGVADEGTDDVEEERDARQGFWVLWRWFGGWACGVHGEINIICYERQRGIFW